MNKILLKNHEAEICYVTKGNNLFCEKSTLVLDQDTHTN